MARKKRLPDPDKPPDVVGDEFKEAADLPARTARKPNADEQEGNWSDDRDYEPNE